MHTLFQLQDELYQAGARNFLFIDVPPMNRSPAGENKLTLFGCLGLIETNELVPVERELDSSVITNYSNWNATLRRCAREFHTRYPDTTVLMFSAKDTFDKVLDDPETFGFSKEDCRKEGGAIWVDHIHPTSRMHEIIATDFERFLSGFPPLDTSAHRPDSDADDCGASCFSWCR